MCPASCRIAGTSGSETNFCQPSASQSKSTHTRSFSTGSRNTVEPFDPCCFLFSAPFVVARIISIPPLWVMSRHQGLLARVRGFNACFVLGVPSSCASLMRGASGGFPISGPSLRLGEFVATFALAQDNAFGQPLESQLRSCLLAAALCEEAGLDRELRETVYWVALLRYIGCTGHAHEVATVFGDEIA